MKKFVFIVPIKGIVETEIIAENEEQAKEFLKQGQGIEGFPQIDTWHISRAFLKEED